MSYSQVNPLFQKLEGDQIEALKKRFSGQQVFDNYDIQGFMQRFSQFLNNKIKKNRRCPTVHSPVRLQS